MAGQGIAWGVEQDGARFTGDLRQCRAALDAAAIAGRINDEPCALLSVCTVCDRLSGMLPRSWARSMDYKLLLMVISSAVAEAA